MSVFGNDLSAAITFLSKPMVTASLGKRKTKIFFVKLRSTQINLWLEMPYRGDNIKSSNIIVLWRLWTRNQICLLVTTRRVMELRSI